MAEDFLKNQEADGELNAGELLDKMMVPLRDQRGAEAESFLISSKPYIRKNNVTSDKALNFCWELQ